MDQCDTWKSQSNTECSLHGPRGPFLERNVPVTFRVRGNIWNQNQKNGGVTFSPQTSSTCFVDVQFYCLVLKTNKNLNLSDKPCAHKIAGPKSYQDFRETGPRPYGPSVKSKIYPWLNIDSLYPSTHLPTAAPSIHCCLLKQISRFKTCFEDMFGGLQLSSSVTKWGTELNLK